MESIELPSKVLIVLPNWLGDIVMAKSFLEGLHKALPQASLDVLAPQAYGKILATYYPEIRQFFVLPYGHGSLPLKKTYRFAQKFKDYDAAFVLPHSCKSSLIPAFAKIPLRLGYKGEFPRQFWLHKTLEKPTTTQAQHLEYFALLQLLDKQHTQKPLWPRFAGEHTKKPIAESYVIFSPGAEFGISKMWPLEHWLKLANLFQDRKIVLLGTHKDQQILFGNNPPKLPENIHNLLGKTTLEEAFNTIAHTDCLVSNDSGLIHVAAAFAVPVVALYGPTPEAKCPPLVEPRAILHTHIDCRPCKKKTCPLKHHRCMKDILPQEVFAATMGILRRIT